MSRLGPESARWARVSSPLPLYLAPSDSRSPERYRSTPRLTPRSPRMRFYSLSSEQLGPSASTGASACVSHPCTWRGCCLRRPSSLCMHAGRWSAAVVPLHTPLICAGVRSHEGYRPAASWTALTTSRSIAITKYPRRVRMATFRPGDQGGRFSKASGGMRHCSLSRFEMGVGGSCQ